MLSNITFTELTIGQQANFQKTLTDEDLWLFAKTSGDINPLHLDEAYAKTTRFGGRIAHGMWSGSLISAAIATVLPGPGTVYLSQNLQFKRPVKLNDTLTVTLTVIEKHPEKPIVTLSTLVKNQHNESVVEGEAKVLAPTEKLTVESIRLSEVPLT